MRVPKSVWIAAAVLVAGGAALFALRSPAEATGPVVEVVKSPTCGCCEMWVDHMRDAGFRVKVRDVDYATLTASRAGAGVPGDLSSCHTATVDGYTIEGHVPAADVRRLLAERPHIRGLSAPGMPGGSPGMESAPAERYDVVAFDASGRRSVWARH
ncbi:MAG TPA: DUF411 domain-containing protein [Gemmatimonadota bacterium]|nr:DUF411 domain-containing protein [Gemmatimonadota bacterium]